MTVADQSESHNRMLRFWRSGYVRRLIPYGAFGALLIVAITILGEEIEHHIAVVEGWISNLGLFGVLAYVILFILLTSVFLPDTVMGIIAGALFGLTFGIIAVFAGALAGSALQYWLARHLIRGRIERIITSMPNLALIQQTVRQQEIRLQFLLRLTPISPVLTSYLLGATGVKFSGFMIACVSLLPVFFLEVYSGYAGRHIARISGRNELAIVLHDILVIGGLILLVIVMFFVSRMARRAIEAAASSASNIQRNSHHF